MDSVLERLSELRREAVSICLAIVRAELNYRERRMPVPQMKGLAAQLRAFRAKARDAMAQLAAEAESEYGAFGGALDQVRSEINEVRAATAEITGDLAETGNGGPPLDSAEPSGTSPDSSVGTQDSGEELRARTWSHLHPSVRQQKF
jgi:hypothetical protein